MSDDETFENVVGAELTVSPLKSLASESHEIYMELREAGFPEKIAALIIAEFIGGSLYLNSEDEDLDEDDDNDEDIDNDE